MQYRLHRKINSGGMADLYLATIQGNDRFKRACAVKIIRGDLADDPEYAAMFRTEAKIYATLQHQNIINVMDVTDISGHAAIVMELVIGTDLEALVRACYDQGTTLPVPMIAYICAEAGKGLQYAHQRKDPMTGNPMGIIHRDVSPGNILISDEGQVKISDFGIAKSTNREHETQFGRIKGKYSYLSPEQIQGEEVTQSVDIFALGVVMWEALAGRRRFAGLADTDIFAQLAKPPQFDNLCDLNMNVEPLLNEIVFKAVAMTPAERYGSVGEFSRVVEAYLRDHHSSFTTEKLATFVRRVMRPQLEFLHHEQMEALAAAETSIKDENPVEKLTDKSTESKVHTDAKVAAIVPNQLPVSAPPPPPQRLRQIQDHDKGLNQLPLQSHLHSAPVQHTSSIPPFPNSDSAFEGQQTIRKQTPQKYNDGSNNFQLYGKGKDLTLHGAASEQFQPPPPPEISSAPNRRADLHLKQQSRQQNRPQQYPSSVVSRTPQRYVEEKQNSKHTIALFLLAIAGLVLIIFYKIGFFK